MANRVSYIFDLVDRFSQKAGRIADKANLINDRIKKLEKRAEGLKRLSSGVQSVGIKMTALSAAILAAGVGALSQSAKFEQLSVAFQTLTGDATKGKDLFEEIAKFSARTPFQLEELAGGAKLLLAFGVQADKVVDVLGRLGDLAAGTGKPIAEFALIFGKIKAKGKITGEELQQLAEKGINLREALGKKFKINAEGVEKAVSKGLIKFEHVRDVLIEMTSKGGRFFNLTQKQSETAAGKWSTLKDNIALAAKEIGDVLFQQLNLKDVMDSVTARLGAFVKGFKAWVEQHPKLTKLALAVIAFVVVLGPLLLALSTLGFMISGIMTALPIIAGLFAAVSAPVLILAGLLGALAALVIKNRREIALFFQFWAEDVPIVGVVIDKIKEAILFFKFLAEDIGEIINKVAAAVAEFASGHISSVLNFVLGLETTSQSQTDINVNLRAEGAVVEGATATSTGDTAGLNVGMNLED